MEYVNEEARDLARKQLSDMLHSGIVKVSFKKVSGEHRQVLATLHQSHLPPVPEGATERRTRKPGAEQVNYWDTSKRQWGSVNMSQLLDAPQLVTKL